MIIQDFATDTEVNGVNIKIAIEDELINYKLFVFVNLIKDKK